MAQRRMFAEYFKEEIEPTKKIDRALLAAIGVKAYPYFKFTGGEHSVVVLGFKQKRKMYIAKFQSEKHAPFNERAAEILRRNGFEVVKRHGTKKLLFEYEGEQIVSYDLMDWIDYDFEIRTRATVKVLNRYKHDGRKKEVKEAVKLLKKMAFETGKFAGRIYLKNIVYIDFRPANLSSGMSHEIVLFDIHGDYLERTNNIKKHAFANNLLLLNLKEGLEGAGGYSAHLFFMMVESYLAGMHTIDGSVAALDKAVHRILKKNKWI